MKRKIALLLALLVLTSGCGVLSKPEPTPAPTAAPTPTATPAPTWSEDMPFALVWGGDEYAGAYTGALDNGLPDGTGVFEGTDKTGSALRWEGGWTAGEPAGEGELTADRFITDMNGLPAAGSYTGRGLDGLPEGEGTFASVNDRGVPWVYFGQWKTGLMEGQGTLRYEAEGYYIRSGTFTAGRWTPTWLESLAALGSCEPCFGLTDEQTAFLAAHPELWEEETHQDFLNTRYKKEIDRSLIVRKCFQDPTVMDTPVWMSVSALRVIRSWVMELEGGAVFTCITAADSTYSYPVRVIVPDRVDGMRRGQRFHVVALPVCLSEYTTVLGAKQPCLVMVAADSYFGTN